MSDYNFFTTSLSQTDPLVFQALENEKQRQAEYIELIASENIVSRAVLDALGHEINNKTLEGYPGNRFHGGGKFVDVVEQAAIDRAKELFNASYVNVQPHSGTQANQAVFFSLVKPGDSILCLDLAAGGHLSHGAKPNLSGRWFDAHYYGINKETGLIDYDQLEQLAKSVRPKLLITGGSSYPREIDFAFIKKVAQSIDALFLVDMAHFAGLVAGGANQSPLGFADLVTCTTTKTMRGPRGGIIMSRSNEWAQKLQSSVFPGVQGSLHPNVIAAKAVCLGEALQPSFKQYARQVQSNARTLAESLKQKNISIISGGTDTHLILLDVSANKINGTVAEQRLAAAHLTSNKNPIPFDSKNPKEWVGLRLGVAAATTRGMKEEQMRILGGIIADLMHHGDQQHVVDDARNKVSQICQQFVGYH